jgi:hypothetical protein
LAEGNLMAGVVNPSDSLASKVKKHSWRFTATYIWLHLLCRLFFGFDALTAMERNVTEHLVSMLAAVGFAPAHAQYLPLVFKITWLLITTAFSLPQLFGFVLYVLTMPIWLPLVVIFHDAVREARSKPANPQLAGLRPLERKLPVMPIFVTLLAGWLLLYGAGTTKLQIAPGLTLAVLILCYASYKAVLQAKPFGDVEIQSLKRIVYVGFSYVDAELTRLEEREGRPQKAELIVDMTFTRWSEWFFRQTMLFFRGKRGQDRIAALVLLDYIFMLLFLGLISLAVWALVLRIWTAPTAIEPLLAVQYAASKFLPGMPAVQLPVAVPWWFGFGPSLTAWILFGLYVGPASSLLASRQKAYAKGVAVQSRGIAKKWRQIRRLLRIKQKLMTVAK